MFNRAEKFRSSIEALAYTDLNFYTCVEICSILRNLEYTGYEEQLILDHYTSILEENFKVSKRPFLELEYENEELIKIRQEALSIFLHDIDTKEVLT